MTQERCKQLIPVMTAFAEGKVIQCRKVGVFDWMDLTGASFDEDCQYRIKPEPSPILPPAFLEALKAYIDAKADDAASSDPTGCPFDHHWSAVEAANLEEVR
jgi:hypothetical protein